MKNRIKLIKKYFRSKSANENETVTKYLEEDIDNVLSRAHTLIGIKKGDLSEPLVIITPNSFYEGGKVRYRIIKLDDEYRVDYDQSMVTSIYLTNESLYYHQASVNHNNGVIDFDIAGELNLFDVTHTETILDYDNVENPKVSQLIFRLNLVDGSNIEFYLRDHFLHDEYYLETLLTEEEEYVINTIKEAIRKSK